MTKPYNTHEFTEEPFDLQFPMGEKWTHIVFEGASLLKVDTLEKCSYCGSDTHWADLSFEGALCSPGCERAMWHEFEEAWNRFSVVGEGEVE